MFKQMNQCIPNERRLILFYQRQMMATADPQARELYRQIIRFLTNRLNGVAV